LDIQHQLFTGAYLKELNKKHSSHSRRQKNGKGCTAANSAADHRWIARAIQHGTGSNYPFSEQAYENA